MSDDIVMTVMVWAFLGSFSAFAILGVVALAVRVWLEVMSGK